MFDIFHRHTPKNIKTELLAGFTVSLAMVPESVAFALIANVSPLVGLYAAFLVGLIAAVIGGRPGMISGAAGALAVVMVSLVVQHGVEYLFAAVVLMGIIQLAAGVFKLGKYIRIVPYPVFLGFVNGLAIVIFLAQLEQFKLTHADGSSDWLSGSALAIMLGLVALTMLIIHFLPRLTRVIPSTLAAILIVTLLVIGFDLDTRTVGDMGAIAGGFPEFGLPMVPFTWETLSIILPYSLILAAIGLIESLLTMTLLDEMTGTRGKGNKVCLGQGSANVVTGLFGGMGGCAMVGQSLINIESGGRGRLSGITAALLILGFILFASQYIEMIPLAALIGVMFIIVLGTFEWGTLRLFGKIPTSDYLVVVLVAAITVISDLAIAVFTGVVVSALVFAWQQAKQMRATTNSEPHRKTYHISGTLFFGSAKNFNELFDISNDPDEVVIDFMNARVSDHSGIEAIDSLAEKYIKAGKTLHLRHLSPECYELLEKAGSLVEINVLEDPRYRVADDKLD